MAERPHKIILGHDEHKIFDTTIQEEYGLRLQDIADADTAEAVQALRTGLHSIILHYGVVRLRQGLVHKGEMQHGANGPKVSREEDGSAAFEGMARLQAEQTSDWAGQALEAGRDIVIYALRDPDQHTYPTSEDELMPVATIRHPNPT